MTAIPQTIPFWKSLSAQNIENCIPNQDTENNRFHLIFVTPVIKLVQNDMFMFLDQSEYTAKPCNNE